MVDDLDRPLGLNPPPPKRQRRLWLAPAIGLVILAAIGVGQALLSKTDAPGGEPHAIAPIQPLPSSPALAPAPPVAAKPGQAATAQQVEEVSGVKIIRGGQAVEPGAVIIQVPVSAPLAAAPDQRVAEKTRYGWLPRRGPGGLTPAEVYARPSAAPAGKTHGPRIALIVGGMGLNAAATAEAIANLPPEVSLAFAPYGAQVERQAAAARAAGHEILLQSPMEPFDMAADNPGPHTLRAGKPGQWTEDLLWQMSRFPGYIGLVNFLGGRYLADRTAVNGFMREMAERGLDFVDDGTSPQSLAGALSPAEKRQGEAAVGFAKADIRLDESARPEAIDEALFRLETLARQKGIAIGFAAGLPAGNDRIARFARDLGQRGLTLIPASAAIHAQNSTRSTRGAD